MSQLETISYASSKQIGEIRFGARARSLASGYSYAERAFTVYETLKKINNTNQDNKPKKN